MALTISTSATRTLCILPRKSLLTCVMRAYGPIHISNTVLPTVKSGPPEEKRTTRQDCGAKVYRVPNHISKTVPPTVRLAAPVVDSNQIQRGSGNPLTGDSRRDG